jgi:hypothetical protein
MATQIAVAIVATTLGAAALALNVLSLPSALPSPQPAPPAATIDLSLIITGEGAVGGPAKHHLYSPQMIVARRGDTIRLRVMNQSLFSHAIVFEGYDVRTGVLPGGPRGQEEISLIAGKGGVFPYRCYIPFDPRTGWCSPDHETMVGYLIVLDPPR